MVDASDSGANAEISGKKAKRQWKKIDPGQILDIQSYEDVRKGSDVKGKGKGEKGKGRGKGEDGEGKGKGKGGKNYNRMPEPSGDAPHGADAGAPPVEAPPPAADGGEQRTPYQTAKGGKQGGKAKGKGFDRGDDKGKGGKGRGGKGRGYHQPGAGLNQGASPAQGAETASPAPASEEPVSRPPPPPQAANSGNNFPGMPGGFMQQPMAGCMACPMPFFDMSQLSMYPGYMGGGGCMPYHMPYNVNQEMMPCMPAPPNPEQRTEQISKAKTQIEHYFSNENLIKDVFLRQNVMDTQGWVPLARLSEFPKLAKIARGDVSILIDAIMQANELEMKPDASAVRLKTTWSRWVLQK